MLTVNFGPDDRLVDGQLCTIKHILKGGNGNVTKIYIEFDDSQAGLKIISKDRCGSEHSCVPFERAESDIRAGSNKDTLPVIKRIQFPLLMAWVCTLHKVQGIVPDKVVISFEF